MGEIMRKTKIICTLGPACRDEKTIVKMINSGMNVARLNFSHQEHSFHKENIDLIKRVRKNLGVPLAVLLDTKGPEIRTGTFETGSVKLATGSTFTLTTVPCTGNENRCFVSCKNLPENLTAGNTVLIDDGKVELCVTQVEETDVICRVVRGGTLGNTRGINVPQVNISMPFISEKDASDIKFGIEQGIDIIAASFVRSRQDVLELRAFLDANGGNDIKIISKIESRFGIENFDEILSVSDGIMVARGDMGVEVPFELLPGIQKKLIKKCYKSGKIAITATQMLETMIENSNPTRAEISDVANAVFDSSSAVMLSGETAIGKDPARVVEVMSKICETAESDAYGLSVYGNLGEPEHHGDITDAVCQAAALCARDVNADAVIAVTHNGLTARLMSKYRPQAKIIGATDNERVFNQLSVNWGVSPMMTLPQPNTDLLFSHVIERALEQKLLKTGDCAVITAGSPVGISGKTNTLKVVHI